MAGEVSGPVARATAFGPLVSADGCALDFAHNASNAQVAPGLYASAHEHLGGHVVAGESGLHVGRTDAGDPVAVHYLGFGLADAGSVVHVTEEKEVGAVAGALPSGDDVVASRLHLHQLDRQTKVGIAGGQVLADGFLASGGAVDIDHVLGHLDQFVPVQKGQDSLLQCVHCHFVTSGNPSYFSGHFFLGMMAGLHREQRLFRWRL